jgi:hypothetical protein
MWDLSHTAFSQKHEDILDGSYAYLKGRFKLSIRG